jgi:hypothetical protein
LLGEIEFQMTESNAAPVHGKVGRGPTKQGQKDSKFKRWLQERIRLLPFKLGIRQAPEMPLGTRVFVFKGDARNDLGQVAIVSAIVGSQVEISYRGPTGQIKTRRKQRASLIVMEDGVELVVTAQGWPILRVVDGRDRTEDDDDIGIVSAGEDSDNECERE